MKLWRKPLAQVLNRKSLPMAGMSRDFSLGPTGRLHTCGWHMWSSCTVLGVSEFLVPDKFVQECACVQVRQGSSFDCTSIHLYKDPPRLGVYVSLPLLQRCLAMSESYPWIWPPFFTCRVLIPGHPACIAPGLLLVSLCLPLPCK